MINKLKQNFNTSGGRSSQAIVDGAMNALRALVKERLSGKSGGSGNNKEVDPAVKLSGSFLLQLSKIWIE